MRNGLSKSEQALVDELIAWDGSRRSWDLLLCNIALVAGGGAIVGAAVYTLFNLTDDVVTGVTVPGFLIGLILFGAYILGGKRVRERHRLATILRKMKGVD